MSGGVRGPNSALTEFLRSQGINAGEIRDRYERRRAMQAQQNQEGVEEAEAAAQSTTDSLENADPQIRAIAEAAAAKRRADMDFENEGTDKCAYCNTQFTLTVYTVSTTDGGVLCRPCGAKVRKQKGTKPGVQARKKQKLVANALLDLKDDICPSLQDICITTVAKFIDEVDELGDLTSANFEKIANILTKNRRLGPKTVQLFLRNDVATLDFADCSQLVPESFYLIPTVCPNLERLTLDMCGLLDDEAMGRFGKLQHLEELYLDGPFQVRATAWIDFFETIGERLKSFSVKSVYRFTPEVTAVLVSNCTNLESLALGRLSQMREAAPLYLIAELSNLKHLELSELEEDVLVDEPIVSVLEAIGANLESLVLKDGQLTDVTIDAISRNCRNLQRLELINLTGITDEAVAAMFNSWAVQECNQNITTLSFERCIGVGDRAVKAALSHCHSSLVELSLNSLKTLDTDLITPISKLPNLNKLDLGFIGNIEPYHIYKLSTSAIKLLLAFGNIRLSRMPLPEGITVVGTM